MTFADQPGSPRRRGHRRPTLPRAFWLVAAGLAATVSLGVVTIAQTAKSKALPNPDSSNLRQLTQITKANVAQLEMAWFYPYGGSVFSPVFAHDLLYGYGRNNSAIIAVDATTGKEVWVHDGITNIQNKGMNYWESEDGTDRR